MLRPARVASACRALIKSPLFAPCRTKVIYMESFLDKAERIKLWNKENKLLYGPLLETQKAKAKRSKGNFMPKLFKYNSGESRRWNVMSSWIKLADAFRSRLRKLHIFRVSNLEMYIFSVDRDNLNCWWVCFSRRLSQCDVSEVNLWYLCLGFFVCDWCFVWLFLLSELFCAKSWIKLWCLHRIHVNN